MTAREQITRKPDRLSPTATAPLKGAAWKALTAKFPARTVPDSWPASTHSAEEVLERLDRPPLRAANMSTHCARRLAARHILAWLESFPGESWHQRWSASSAHRMGSRWRTEALAWLHARNVNVREEELRSGLLALLCADVIRPDLGWLSENCRRLHWRIAMTVHRDPDGFRRLEELADSGLWDATLGLRARNQLAILLMAKGGVINDITVGDCLELREIEIKTLSLKGGGHSLFYSLLKGLRTFPGDAPATLRGMTVHTGQVGVGQLVDRYSLQFGPARDVIVDYLSERQPVMDYTSLENLSRVLALHFWKNLELHNPGIESFHLTPEVAAAWKHRLQTKTAQRKQSNGSVIDVVTPRRNVVQLMSLVRAFYLDIAQWAAEDPSRWGVWAVPCPISQAECTHKKHISHRKARMDQRTRERLPALPTLVAAADKQLKNARIRLDAVRAAPAGQSFTVLGEVFAKATSSTSPNPESSTIVTDAAGRRRDLGQAEKRAFWSWAAVEFFRHTGVRIEEMLETSHHSITQYTLPGTGELIPLLQIAPSKTDEERLLVVGPELADVLSAIVCRVRDSTGAIPLIESYDMFEKTWNPPMPLLFQWRSGGQDRRISESLIRRGLTEILQESGLTDAAGEPLHYQPHDFRRIFTTEAIMNGMPPHIAQLILGHKDIGTTMGYKAVYPEEAINGHRAFIARRRELRPSEEYRAPTDVEWDEFLGHFERRKVALGDCGRAYGTSCQHEHSCVRCPLLRVDPAQRPRLQEIHDNLTARIVEAEREG
ncbi:site-specific integrase [Streptomyces virginiae]|uniref:site-specific integrase n=1 Tax=Streptomyces virginiae TaxID=1961 RepID=UPI002E2D5DC6|nr:site-specific integrase [Streptomyces virginiae]